MLILTHLAYLKNCPYKHTDSILKVPGYSDNIDFWLNTISYDFFFNYHNFIIIQANFDLFFLTKIIEITLQNKTEIPTIQSISTMKDVKPSFEHFRLSPDGKNVAFCDTRQMYNIWSLEFEY